MEDRLADGTLVGEVRQLIETAAVERLGRIRANTRTAMVETGQDAVTIAALTGVAAGTVKNFLERTDTSIRNVLLIAVGLGLSLGDLERPPDEFLDLLRQRTSKSASRRRA
jgi:hypothetical protein